MGPIGGTCSYSEQLAHGVQMPFRVGPLDKTGVEAYIRTGRSYKLVHVHPLGGGKSVGGGFTVERCRVRSLALQNPGSSSVYDLLFRFYSVPRVREQAKPRGTL